MSQLFSFLNDLAANNNRPWFEENKKRYEAARKEAEGVLEACIGEIGKFEDLGPLKAKDTMFRIYRDVRFSKNKDPYKLNFSGMIAREGRKAMVGFGYYVHFQPGESFMAAGVYEPNPEQLARIRQEIDYNSEEIHQILSQPEFQSMFGQIQGNQLKTAPKGYPKDHPDIALLRYTQFYCMTSFRDEEVLSPDFPIELARRCRIIRPFLEFLNRAIEM